MVERAVEKGSTAVAHLYSTTQRVIVEVGAQLGRLQVNQLILGVPAKLPLPAVTHKIPVDIVTETHRLPARQFQHT